LLSRLTWIGFVGEAVAVVGPVGVFTVEMTLIAVDVGTTEELEGFVDDCDLNVLLGVDELEMGWKISFCAPEE